MPFGGIGFDEYGEPIKAGGSGIVPVSGGGGGVGGGGGGGGFAQAPAIDNLAALQAIGQQSYGAIPITVRKRGMPRIPGVTPGKPTPNDTVPAMLTPGEIVMNPGVTANPQLAQLLLAINQRGARNMQSGLGPVGMEFGGRIPGYAAGGMVPGQEDSMEEQGQHMMPDGTMMPGAMHGGEMPEAEGEMQAQGGEGHENPYPSSAVRILQLLLELDEAEQAEYGGGGMGPEGHAFGGFAGLMGGGLNRLNRFQNTRFGRAAMQGLASRLGQAGGAGGALAGLLAYNQSRKIMTPGVPSQIPTGAPPTPPTMNPSPMQPQTMTPEQPAPGFAYGGEVPGFGFGGWLKARFKSPSKPKIDPYGMERQQVGDISAARQAGYFDPRGNQALIRSQEEAARGTADALVRRQMSQANLGGLDPAQRAVAKQQAMLQTGRGVQDIMAQTRANAMGAQDQFFKQMYGGAASAAMQARMQNDLAKAEAARQGGIGQAIGQIAGAYMNPVGTAAGAAKKAV